MTLNIIEGHGIQIAIASWDPLNFVIPNIVVLKPFLRTRSGKVSALFSGHHFKQYITLPL